MLMTAATHRGVRARSIRIENIGANLARSGSCSKLDVRSAVTPYPGRPGAGRWSIERELVRGRALGAETRVGAHAELREFALGLRLALEQRAEHGAQESERDADDPGILERKDRIGLQDARAL